MRSLFITLLYYFAIRTYKNHNFCIVASCQPNYIAAIELTIAVVIKNISVHLIRSFSNNVPSE